MEFDTDEIIKVKIGNKLSRDYKSYKGTFAALVYNCIEKKALPGFHGEALVLSAKQGDKTLSVTLSGRRPDEELMGIMDIVLTNVSAFPEEGGKAQFSISIKQGEQR